MNHSLIVTLIVTMCICGFCAGNGYAADKPTTPQPTALTEQQQAQVKQWSSRIDYISTREGELVKEIGTLEAERNAILQQFQKLQATLKKPDGKKAPVKPAEATSQGVKKP